MSSAYDTVPSISADGRRLAYSSCNGELLCDIWVQELDSTYAPRGGGRRITHQASFIRSVAWSRDARSIVYTGTLSGGRLSYLWRAAIDEQRGPQRLEIAGPNVFSHSISGNRLIFSRALANSDIWRYQLGRSVEPLITSSLDDNNPQFSPDGTRIAFSSSRTGEAMEIWVAHADGSQVVQMTNGLGRHQGSPRWSPDGRWIAFDSQRENGHWNIYVIDAAGGRPRRITFDPSEEHTSLVA